ncbi:hypothetical protein BU26DRAFT_569176 [Trematosphaeria pertusa]|uniref:Uncharacterized protein n=1 Tax=Trematosphaeria pertusa TaxID=390896 RepID=A0A6A6I152_9PLEO|nr:uncharacterized protein BU26DRAFT_569176 [Trematosphaeria pertusa]KAF2244175.1 hypothetical protein BU26DRAFT_569176 [Trematosphaeria pertusa]
MYPSPLAALFALLSTRALASPLAPSTQPICLEICYLQKPDCARNGFPMQQNECWTCCTREPPKPEPPLAICLAICYFEKPECGRGSYAAKQNECWTCCTPQQAQVPPTDA